MEFRPHFKMQRHRNWRKTLGSLAPQSTTLDKSGRWVAKELHGRRDKMIGRFRPPSHELEALVKSTAPRAGRKIGKRRSRA